VALQFIIEGIVRKEIEDRSLKEFGSANVPRKLRMGFSDARVFQLKPAVS
jgi:hypothetical protein